MPATHCPYDRKNPVLHIHTPTPLLWAFAPQFIPGLTDTHWLPTLVRPDWHTQPWPFHWAPVGQLGSGCGIGFWSGIGFGFGVGWIATQPPWTLDKPA